MAQWYFGINRGQYAAQQVLFNTATNGTDIEIRIDTSKKLNEADRSLAIEQLLEVIRQPNLLGLAFPGWYDNNG